MTISRALRFTVEIDWNKTRVCVAQCTAVVAHDLVRSFVEGNFAGQDMRDYVREVFDDTNQASWRVDAIRQLAYGERMTGDYHDETGECRFAVTCSEPA